MRATKFKHFEPKVDSLKEVPLKYESTPIQVELGCPIDGPELEGKPLGRQINALPCMTIFVHGVNSEGEWYSAAEQHLCAGLNDRLGRWGTRAELKPSVSEKDPNYTYSPDRPLKRIRPHFDGVQNAVNSRYLVATSPVIFFYWGFKARKGDYGRPSEHDYRDAHHPELRDYPVALDEDDAWGGGPFQNGTSGLWHMFRKNKGFTLDFQRFNPITDRYLTECPPRTYYVHAARRLAHLIATVRRNSPHETINIVSHSQGTMVSMLATLMLKEQGVRGPEGLFVCNSPFSLNEPGGLMECAQFGNDYVVTQAARFATLKAVADVVKEAGEHADAMTDDELEKMCHSTLARKPLLAREEYGKFYVYANPHDRVMGASVLRSIGWRGLTQAEQSRVAAANLRVRMFAENIEAGKGGYHYPVCPKSFAITKDDDGKEIHMERTEFWIPKSEKIGGVYGIYSPPEKAEEAVYINAPTVPWLADQVLRQHMEQTKSAEGDPVWKNLANWDGRLKDFHEYRGYLHPTENGGDARDVAAYGQVYGPNYEVERMEVDVYGKRYPVYKTVAEAQQDLVKTAHNLTNHSTLPSNEFVVRGVMAWDLALGLNQSYTDFEYWAYLKTLADWKYSDPYFMENDEGHQPEPGEPPPGVDRTLAYPQRDPSIASASEPVVTGYTCPQTGWWQCNEAGAIASERRQFIREGQIMPKVAVAGEPSLWQRVKGERPVWNTATVWTLASDTSAPQAAQAGAAQQASS
ncbi:T6SS effector phospholipase Tle3 domain-containing protein [Ralstonia nicotianae]